MNKISIATAKRIREELGASHLIIYAFHEGETHIATHGETDTHAAEAAQSGNMLKVALGWPESLCQAKPLPRLCENCVFWKPYYGTRCFNGWTDDGSRGHCHFEPTPVATGKADRCGHFQPNC